MLQPALANNRKRDIEPVHRGEFVALLNDAAHHMAGKQIHALIHVTLHGFKDLEQRHGPDATKQLQHQVVELAQAELLQGDQVAELGDGQLGILLRDRSEQHALLVARLLRHALQHLAFRWNGQPVSVSAMFSVLTFNHPKCNAEALLKIAADASGDANRPGSSHIEVLNLQGSS